jgi:hypothetical protein
MYYMTWQGINPVMSPQLPCKSNGQHLFNLLVFVGCSSGCNMGLQVVVMFIGSFMGDFTYVRDDEVRM